MDSHFLGGGLHLGERHQGKLTFRQFVTDNRHQCMMRAMIQDRTGLIWVGTNDGVIVFHPDELIQDKNKYISLHLHKEDQQSLSHNEVKVVLRIAREYLAGHHRWRIESAGQGEATGKIMVQAL